MGDYLGNLVAKSLNLAEVVQPRPVSLFEPPPKAGWPASVHPSGLETVDDRQAAFDTPSPVQPLVGQPETLPPVTSLRPPSDAGQQQSGDLSATLGWPPSQPAPGPAQPVSPHRLLELSRTDRPPVEPAPQPVEGNPVQPSTLPGSGPVQPQSFPTVEPLVRPTATRSSTGPTPQPVETTPPASSVGQEPPVWPIEARLSPAIAPQEPILDRPRPPLAVTTGETAAVLSQSAAERESHVALEPVAQQIVPGRTVPPAVPRPTRERRPTAIDEAESPSFISRRGLFSSVEGGVSPGEPRSATVVAQPHVRPVQRVEPAPSAPAQSVPTIQVTIGRVEVRATPPVPPPKKQRPRPPVMSLDEYLRQRNQGGHQ